jgi:hypothetical protein
MATRRIWRSPVVYRIAAAAVKRGRERSLAATSYRWVYYGFGQIRMTYLWLSHGYRMAIAWLSHGYRMAIAWLSHGYRIVARADT